MLRHYCWWVADIVGMRKGECISLRCMLEIWPPITVSVQCKIQQHVFVVLNVLFTVPLSGVLYALRHE